jgi:CheY-like chemotaxis protein
MEAVMLLIVDDHGDTREILIRLLKIEGYESIGVKCGTEALLFLKTHKPRLVLLDYSMPDIDGLTVFREIKTDVQTAGIPVIMFSANEGDIRDEAIQAGVDAYVVKGSLDWPFLRKEILRLAGPGTVSSGEPAMPPRALNRGA